MQRMLFDSKEFLFHTVFFKIIKTVVQYNLFPSYIYTTKIILFNVCFNNLLCLLVHKLYYIVAKNVTDDYDSD